MRALAKPLPKDVENYFYYDTTSPSCLRWKITRFAKNNGRLVVSKGEVAGHLRKDGYWTVKLSCESIKIHRIIYYIHNPEVNMEDIIIDHKNGNSSDNNICNLLQSTDYLNGKNKKKYKSNSTGVTGVHSNEKNPGRLYYVATWRYSDKRIGAKSFSLDKYGENEALRLAVEYRKKQIKILKESGAGYTERHGT